MSDAPSPDERPDPSPGAERGRPSTTARVLKALVLLVVIAVAVVVLFTTVFPWVEERTQDPTIGIGHPAEPA